MDVDFRRRRRFRH